MTNLQKATEDLRALAVGTDMRGAVLIAAAIMDLTDAMKVQSDRLEQRVTHVGQSKPLDPTDPYDAYARGMGGPSEF